MTFRSAVRATPEIKDAWKRGLQALPRAVHKHIEVKVPRRLSGSVDLDTTLAQAYPNDSRWDYGIGYRTHGSGETAYWVEIHPSRTGEIKTVIDKLDWLKNWLEHNSPQLDSMPKVFVWVASGKTSFTQNSPQAKKLAQAGLRHVGRRLTIQ